MLEAHKYIVSSKLTYVVLRRLYSLGRETKVPILLRVNFHKKERATV